MIGDVSAHARQLSPPDPQQSVDRTFSNLKRRQMRQKVISNEEYQQDPVINRLLEVERERHLRHVQFSLEILS